MNSVKYFAGLLSLFALIGCAQAEHHVPTRINVERDKLGPKHSLYQHHDIMLSRKRDGGNDASDSIPDATARDAEEEPVAAIQPDEEGSDLAKDSNPPLLDAELWRKRVYPEEQRDRANVFDLAQIPPKIHATRPAWPEEGKSAFPRQKPLMQREITRLGEDGKLTRSYRKLGSVD